MGGLCFLLVHAAACSDDDATGVVLSSEEGSSESSSESASSTEAGHSRPDELVARHPRVRFVEVATELGLSGTQSTWMPTETCPTLNDIGVDPVDDCQIRRFTGGAAVADFDDDGLADIYVPRLDGPDQLYRNLGPDGFEDVAEAWGLASSRASSGAAWADVDGDGDLDLIVSALGEGGFQLFIREDDTFVDQAAARGAALDLDPIIAGMSVQPGDFDGDGYTDLLFTEWMDAGHQSGEAPDNARLLRNRGSQAPGYFEDVSVQWGLDFLAEGIGSSLSFSASFADLNGDGRLDLVWTADFGRARVFLNDGSQFVEEVDSGLEAIEFAMGTALADLDADGDFDLYISSIGENPDFDVDVGFPFDRNHVLLNDGTGSFEAVETGAERCGYGWGTAAADLDADGRVDLAATNGYYHPDPVIDHSYRNDRSCLFLASESSDADVRFVAQTPGIGFADVGQGRGLYPVDIDNDGDLDLLETRSGDTPLLWKAYLGQPHAWLSVEPRSHAGSADARDAVVAVRGSSESVWRLEAIGQNSTFLGHGELKAHYGFSDSAEATADVRVCWQSAGVMVELLDVALRQRVVVHPIDGFEVSEPCLVAVQAP